MVFPGGCLGLLPTVDIHAVSSIDHWLKKILWLGRVKNYWRLVTVVVSSFNFHPDPWGNDPTERACFFFT